MDGSSALHLHIGWLRLVCQNGLVAGHSVYSARVIHRQGQRIENFLHNLPDAVARALGAISSGAALARMEQLTAQPLSDDQQISIIQLMLADGHITPTLAAHIADAHARRRPEDARGILNDIYQVTNEVMRRRGRSELAQLERNVNLLDTINGYASKLIAA